MSAEAAPEVSVVIPLHDKRATVRRAVESVLAQGVRNIELLVVDDGSTDGSADELLAVGDPRLRVLRTPRRGPGAARNLGARNSRADWIAFLDADDEWETSFLEKALAAARANPGVVLVFCDTRSRGSPARPLGLGSGLLDDYYDARLRHGISVSSSSNLLRAVTIAALGGFPEDYMYGEDIETWLRLASRGPFYFIAEALSIIEWQAPGRLTRHATSLERAAGLQHLLDRFAELQLRGEVPAVYSLAWRTFMSHQRGRQALHLARAGLRVRALRTLVRVPINSHTWRDWLRCLAHVLTPPARS